MALAPAERRALLIAWALFFLVEILLRARAFTRLAQRIQTPARAPARPPGPSVERLASLVELAARAVPLRATCLTKALVLGWLLARAGLRVRLQIGVARGRGRLEAHAWLESGGEVIFGLDAAAPYAPLMSAAAR